LTNITEPVYDVSYVANDTILISRRTSAGTAIVELQLRRIFVDLMRLLPKTNEFALSNGALTVSADTSFSGKPSNPHKLTFDLAQGAIGLTTSQESDGGLQIVLSDMVG